MLKKKTNKTKQNKTNMAPMVASQTAFVIVVVYFPVLHLQ